MTWASYFSVLPERRDPCQTHKLVALPYIFSHLIGSVRLSCRLIFLLAVPHPKVLSARTRLEDGLLHCVYLQASKCS